jgi:hypothetical protein
VGRPPWLRRALDGGPALCGPALSPEGWTGVRRILPPSAAPPEATSGWTGLAGAVGTGEMFRDWLRTNAEDRMEYKRKRRELAGQFRDMNRYADAKDEIIERILRKAFGANPS